MEQEIEIWKPIRGYENFYEVSNLGNVRSLDRIVKRPSRGLPDRIKKGRTLQFSKVPGKYLHCAFCVGGKVKSFDVHRLVAEAFVPNPSNLPEVDHKDDNKHNPAASNLQWITRQGNATRAKESGLMKRGVLAYNAVATPEMVLKIRELYAGEVPSQLKLAKMFGISSGAVWYIVNRKSWTHI